MSSCHMPAAGPAGSRRPAEEAERCAAAAAPRRSGALLAALCGCFGAPATRHHGPSASGAAGAAAVGAAPPQLLAAKKAAAASGTADGSPAAAVSGSGGAAAAGAHSGHDSASSSCIAAVYEPLQLAKRPSAAADILSCGDDGASTSYPTTSLEEEWDVLGVCMTTAQEMEACVDAVLDGSIKSAATLFGRYDMDLDQRLAQQDLYDLCLELALALPYAEYACFVEAAFACTDADRDGLISLVEFVPLYKAVAAARRAFRRQDHHNNGQIDRFDFHQLLVELSSSAEVAALLGLEEEQQQQQPLSALSDAAFSLADTTGRGIVNFGQTLVWLFAHLLAREKHRQQQQQS